MFHSALMKGFDKQRLRLLLALFFCALAIPTAVLIWQAFGQLKWEAYHQYRGMAEELVDRIDARLGSLLDTAEARSFADYTFLVVTGDPSANFLQRSPLAAYPAANDLLGVLGYFQIGSDGEFSTPLLPNTGGPPATLGIAAPEYQQRAQLAQRIRAILSDNRLVQYRATERAGVDRAGLTADRPVTYYQDHKPGTSGEQRARRDAEKSELAILEQLAEQVTGGGERDVVRGLTTASEQAARDDDQIDSQLAFDELAAVRGSTHAGTEYGAKFNTTANATDKIENKQRTNTLGKVGDLKLDPAYQKKSYDLEQSQRRLKDREQVAATNRVTRKEKIALPETTIPADQAQVAGATGAGDVRISTFESEVDPLEFSLLDSGHFVLFRKVWRNGERYIQGLLIDQSTFVRAVFDRSFNDTALSAMSNLIIAYHDDVIHTISGRPANDYRSSPQELTGALLYQSRLSAPLASLELIFSIERLPPGPGATVLGWVTLVLALVLCGGFYTLYRLGLSQIDLATQQQDFVAAVSHELKTPLTSIRMYGEMLKEGWADEDKKQTYYEFIHDESERLTRLIANVLQLARITRNEPQLDLQPVTVGALMDQIESKISNQVQRAGFELKLMRDAAADPVLVLLDQDCFAQIVINLADNAIKFSANAQIKRIEITSRLTGEDQVLFAVRDFGAGVPKDQMKKIFKLFYRSESELTRETVGTGIGLAIVHQLTVAMDGKVDVINTDPGAEFRVSFSRYSQA